MSQDTNVDSQKELENEIADLESRLEKAKQRLKSQPKTSITIANTHHNGPSSHQTLHPLSPSPLSTIRDTSHHHLLLLSDSALPLGSFAFSSGLESYLAHTRRQQQQRGTTTTTTTTRAPSPFTSFLPLSLSSYASTTLPFVLAAHRDPSAAAVAELDDQLDAAIVCAVGRRASVAQGRALLSIWEKSFAPSAAVGGDDDYDDGGGSAARDFLRPFGALLRSGSGGGSRPAPAPTATTTTTTTTIDKNENEDEDEDAVNVDLDLPSVSAHLAPLFGAIARQLGLTLAQTAYVFMLSHVKALVSAAVRAGLFGPYMAQRVLAGAETQRLVAGAVEREWETRVEEAGQTVPVMDLWVGRHELLYSRIFNS